VFKAKWNTLSGKKMIVFGPINVSNIRFTWEGNFHKEKYFPTIRDWRHNIVVFAQLPSSSHDIFHISSSKSFQTGCL